ncbi:MAG: lytic transglycosylase domain-containing protein [Desulfobacteraceae bacterium]|nr:lytic transglycosylase domain-containing protein [Desulfobacteraceae bacterium]
MAGLVEKKDRGTSPHQPGGPGQGVRFFDLLNAAQTHGEHTRPTAVTGLKAKDYFERPVQVKARVSPVAGRHQRIVSQTKGNAAPHRLPAAETVKLPPVTDIKARIEKSIRAAAVKYGLPIDLIKGVVKAESNFDVRAVSRAGARGLMQLMPATAKELGVRNSFDIDQNIDGGARYLRQMLDRFGNDTKVALAAYNAGPGTVEKYNGNVPYEETRNYVRKVMSYSKQFA